MIWTQLLPDGVNNLGSYTLGGGYEALRFAATASDELRSTLLNCDITGLGGAHFPFARKLELALQGPAPRVVVCNGAEDEPGSRKDRALLERNPHLVLEGLLVAALAAEATDVYVYVSESLIAAIDSVSRALLELEQEPPVPNLPRIEVVKAPTSYVAGEASAAVRAIGGDEAKPATQPPYPTEVGVSGRPTLVNNCETLANVPRAVLGGHEASRAAWTRLVTVTGDVSDPDVYEVVPSETTFGDLIELAGGMADPQTTLKAIQPGGPSSAYLAADACDCLLTNEAIRAAGSQPGCLAVRVLAHSRCMVEEVEAVTAFFAREQCGQCPACRMKTSGYATAIKKIANGAGAWSLLEQLEAIDGFVEDMPTRCALISMPTAPVKSALRLFRSDFASHIERSGCSAAAPTI